MNRILKARTVAISYCIPAIKSFVVSQIPGSEKKE